MKNFWVFLLVLPLFLNACQKENFADESFDLDFEFISENNIKGDNLCFEINFPVTIILPNGTEVENDSKEDLMRVVKRYYWSHKKERGVKIEFKYPISVNYNGQSIRLRSSEGLDRIRKACADEKRNFDQDKTPCLSLVYPVNFNMPDGSVMTVLDEKNSAQQMKRWFDAHTDFERQRPDIQYPVDVVFKGQQMTVENEQRMQRLRQACKGEAKVNVCFQMIYPLTYTMPDGKQFQVESKEHADQFFKRWYGANTDFKDKKPVLVFPIKIQYPPAERGGDSKIVEIADAESLKKSYEGCGK